jgi:hypothetical protein
VRAVFESELAASRLVVFAVSSDGLTGGTADVVIDIVVQIAVVSVFIAGANVAIIDGIIILIDLTS